MGATRDLALTSLPFRGIAINETGDSGSVTVVASDSGLLFINEYAGTTTYTLPTVADMKGKWYTFYGNVAQDIVITGGTADVMSGGTASAVVDADKVTGGGAIGIWCAVICDGTNYFVLPGVGTWTASG